MRVVQGGGGGGGSSMVYERKEWMITGHGKRQVFGESKMTIQGSLLQIAHLSIVTLERRL